MDIPIQDYTCYAVSHALRSLHSNEQQLFEKLVDFIANSLEDDYCYVLDSFPSSESKENTGQREQRKAMIQQWVKELDLLLGMHWLEGDILKINTLNMLFYAIWNIRWRRPASTSAMSTSDKSTSATTSSTTQTFQSISGQRTWNTLRPAEILTYALPKIREQHSARYGELLDSEKDLVGSLSKYLRGPVWQLSQKQRISRQDLINIGGDLDCHRSAIYLHIIWNLDDDEDDFFLYVGQSRNLAKRLSDHMNPLFRIKHPSLHYYAWDSRPRNMSAFVILAYLDEPTNFSTGTGLVIGKDDQLKMNIVELWGALIFQTLSERELSKYIDPTTIVRRQHLNVANPLWQGDSNLEDEYANISKKERFTALLHGADDITRGYYHSLRDEFYALKDSINPTLREYYHTRRELAMAGLVDSNNRKMAQVLQDLRYGCEKVVHDSNWAYIIIFGCFKFRISKTKYPEVVPQSTVFAQGFLHEGTAKECYCSETEEADPARRFCLRITGSSLGRPYSYFIEAGGDKTAQNINALVDLLEGVKKEDIVNRPRRALARWDEQGFIGH